MIEGALIALAALIFAYVRERDHAKERDTLLNRIQAPQTAVAQSMPDPTPEAKFVVPDDDQDFWTVYDDRKVS